jgi:hypothetical protein
LDLVAGGVQLLRLADADEVQLPGLGDSRTVGGIVVTVLAVRDIDDLTVVDVALQGSPGGPEVNGGDGWTLLRRTTFGPVSAPPEAGVACGTITVTETETRCSVTFAAPGDDGRFLAYRRGDVEARWALDG